MAELVLDQKQKLAPLDKDNKIARVKSYPSRFKEAIRDVFVDERDETHGLTNIVSQLVSGESTKYQRTVALLQLASLATPKAGKKKLKQVYGYTQELMPFNPTDYQLVEQKIGMGGANNVYLLKAQRDGLHSFVLKASHASKKSDDPKKLLEIARTQKKEYEQIASVYQDIKGLVPSEKYVVLHGPDKATPVVAMIQKFEGSKIRDIFDDFTPEELKHLLDSNDFLKAQFEGFVEKTRSNPWLLENELDLLGKNNLAVVGEGENARLLFLDPHFREASVREDETSQEISKRFQYLEGFSTLLPSKV